MVAIEGVDEQGGKHCTDGYAVVVDADEIDLPFLPAEREQQFHAPVHVNQEKVEDEMRTDTDAEREQRFSYILEEHCNDAGNKERSDGSVEGVEELGRFSL